MVVTIYLVAVACLLLALAELFWKPHVDSRMWLIVYAGLSGLLVLRAVRNGDSYWFWLYVPVSLAVIGFAAWLG